MVRKIFSISELNESFATTFGKLNTVEDPTIIDRRSGALDSTDNYDNLYLMAFI